MKRKLTVFLAILLCFTSLTACGKVQTSSFTGSYWLDNYSNKTAPDGFYEKLEYEVTTEKVEKTEDSDYVGTLVSMGTIKFEIDKVNSSYVTELYTENGNYVYETSLTVNGTYYYGADGKKEMKIENDVTKTKTVFKDFENGFKVVSSQKQASNVFPASSSPSSEQDFKKVAYESIIEYGAKEAKVTLKTNDPISKEYFTTLSEPVTVKKYNKKAYIESEIMPLIFRSFKYDSSLVYTFNTIENITGTLKEITGKAKTQTQQTTESQGATQKTIVPMTIELCSLDGGKTRNDLDFDVMGVTFSTTGEFAQTFLTAYYETARRNVTDTKTRHYMVKAYRPMIYNCTYMVYTLHNVYNERV